MTTTIHKNLVLIISKYLGPAAERFVDRQIEFHLQKSPEEVCAEDIEPLNEWITISIAHLTNDADLVDQVKKEIDALKNSQD